MLAALLAAAVTCLVARSSGSDPDLSPVCWAERRSGAGNSSCTAPQPFLIFGHGRSIHRIGLDGQDQQRLVAGVGSSILLDFHFREESVFWANRRTGVIYRASVRGANTQKLTSDKHISGLAVDWVRNVVYWTTGKDGEVKRVDTNGDNRRTVLRGLTRPSSICVDPNRRFLFWLSGGTAPSIQRWDVPAQVRTTVLTVSSERLKALTVDPGQERLFWAQFGVEGRSAIASCDYSGSGLSILEQPLRSRLISLSVFLENIFYSEAPSQVVKKVNKYTGADTQQVNIKPMAKPPIGIKVVHPLTQPTTSPPSADCDEQSGICENVCSRLAEEGVCRCREGFTLSKDGSHCEDVNECAHWNHGCSLGCENVPGSYFCTCPRGYALLPDRKTCREIVPCGQNVTGCGHGCVPTESGEVCVCPEGSILQEGGRLCTGCSSADRGGCSQLCTPAPPGGWLCDCLPGFQLHRDGKRCTAAGAPPFLLVANLVDVRRVSVDGSHTQTLVDDPKGSILAVDYDPVQEEVYFASAGQRTIERVHLRGRVRQILLSDGLVSPEGLAIDWVHRKMYWTDTGRSTLECSALTGLNREVVVSEGLQKPRAIAVHPLQKKLFWTDSGTRPVVESSSLDGGSRVVLASAGLVTPTGLSIDFTEERLFWCDQGRGVIESAALDGSDRRALTENHVGRPFDLAVFEDLLWVSDWGSRQLRAVHKRTGGQVMWSSSELLLLQPASLVLVHELSQPGGGAPPPLSSHRMISDQSGCGSVRCHVHARCHLEVGGPHCKCVGGFTGDGLFCEKPDSPPLDVTSPSSSSPVEQSTPQQQNRNSVQRCPDSHEAYCLYNGVCLYFPQMEAYGCNCLSGFVGERCQFSDLEWLELQRAEQEKKRNVAIAGGALVLLTLLAVSACVAHRCRTRRLLRKQPWGDDESESTVADEGGSDDSNPSATEVQICVALKEKDVPPADGPESGRSPPASQTETSD